MNSWKPAHRICKKVGEAGLETREAGQQTQCGQGATTITNHGHYPWIWTQCKTTSAAIMEPTPLFLRLHIVRSPRQGGPRTCVVPFAVKNKKDRTSAFLLLYHTHWLATGSSSIVTVCLWLLVDCGDAGVRNISSDLHWRGSSKLRRGV